MLRNMGIKALQVKSVIVSGMGVFSDSYNLYAISLVFIPVKGFLGLSTFEASAITGSSFFGAAAGALLFGLISDRIGRKPMYGLDLMLIFLGAFSQFFASSFTTLFIGRLVLGFGIGGDYVMSPVIMAENSNTRDRGKLMVMAFSIMYLLGATLSAFVVQVTSLYFVPEIAWKIVLGFGAIPSLFVIYYRRKIPETSRFNSRVKGIRQDQGGENEVAVEHLGKDSVGYLTRLKRSGPFIAVGAALWILYDTYSSTFTIYGPITIAANLGLTPVQFTYAAVFLAGFPGTIICTLLIDRIGRRKLVGIGYTGVFIALMLYAILLIDPGVFHMTASGAAETLTGAAAVAGFTFYLFNYLFSAIGPATVIGGTVIVPELIPTKVRASGQGFNVFFDKMAAGLTITSFPLMLEGLGLGYMLVVYAVIAIGSSFLMYNLLPETKNRTLEEISGESGKEGRETENPVFDPVMAREES